MNRAEHIQWCKKRALEYIEAGDVTNAITSMMSDLSKHPETEKLNDMLGQLGLIYAMNNDIQGAKRWIKGFAE